MSATNSEAGALSGWALNAAKTIANSRFFMCHAITVVPPGHGPRLPIGTRTGPGMVAAGLIR